MSCLCREEASDSDEMARNNGIVCAKSRLDGREGPEFYGDNEGKDGDADDVSVICGDLYNDCL